MFHRAEQQHRGDQSEELDKGDTQSHGAHHIQLSRKPTLERMGTAFVPPQRRVLGSNGEYIVINENDILESRYNKNHSWST